MRKKDLKKVIIPPRDRTHDL